jgi:hypothetical protein
MRFRAAKNSNNVIICIGSDENQSGNYPTGSSNEERQGVWCDWTFAQIPNFAHIEDAEPNAMRFKENEAGDDIELRTDEEVLADPQG